MDSYIISDRSRAEKASRIAQSGEGINPEYVSLIENQAPKDYVGGTGVPYGQKLLTGDLIQRLFWDTEAPELGWQNLGEPFPSSKYVDDKASLLQNEIDDLEASQQAGAIGYEDKATMDADTSQPNGTIGKVMNDSIALNNGGYRWDGSSWVKKAEPVELADNIRSWAKTEAFFYTANIVKDRYGNETSADIEWPNGQVGVLSNVTANRHGWSSARLTYTEAAKYATLTITRDSLGEIISIDVELTGI